MGDSVSDTLPESFDVSGLLRLLCVAYAEEVEAFHQYWVVRDFLVGLERVDVERTFNHFAHDELLDHGGKLLKRINELGGDISSISSLDKVHSLGGGVARELVTPYEVGALLQQNVESEKLAIARYREICAFCEGVDYVTFNVAREILSDEENHLSTLLEYLADLGYVVK